MEALADPHLRGLAIGAEDAGQQTARDDGRMTCAGSLALGRTMGTASVVAMAWNMAMASANPTMPCWQSTVAASTPVWQATSLA